MEDGDDREDPLLLLAFINSPLIGFRFGRRADTVIIFIS